MKRRDRQQAITDLLVIDGEVDLDDLAERFGMSRMTIHRDLDELESAGVLRKIRGGATVRAGTQFESDFRIREHQDAAEKAAMAQTALTLVEPGMSVMVNDGSMAAILGQRLAEKRPLTVITNNAAVMDALRGEAGITLIALGGVYSAKFHAYLGKVTEDALAGLRADIAFISTPAVSGLDVFHMDDSVLRTKRMMMDSAAQCCLIVKHTRFDKAALYQLASLNEFDHIITDAPPDAEAHAALTQAGLSLIIAEQGESGS